MGVTFKDSDGDVVDYDADQLLQFQYQWNTSGQFGRLLTTTGPNVTYEASTTAFGTNTFDVKVTFGGQPISEDATFVAKSDGNTRGFQIALPGGIAVDAGGSVYVSDQGTGADTAGSIVMFPKDSAPLPIMTGLNSPGDIKLTSDGRGLIITEAGGKVSRHYFGVSGRVRDVSNNLLLGATVFVKTSFAGMSPGFTTSGDGFYFVPDLLKPEVSDDFAEITVEFQGKRQTFLTKLGQGERTAGSVTRFATSPLSRSETQSRINQMITARARLRCRQRSLVHPSKLGPLIAVATLWLAAPVHTAAQGSPPTMPTTIDIMGGAAAADQHLPAGQAQFGLRVPLKINSENVLTVMASNEVGGRVTSHEFTITQLSLTDIVRARVTAQRLTPAEVHALVADGTINVTDPTNFNVSRFDIVLTINGRDVPISVPVMNEVADPALGFGPPITIGCQQPGKGLATTDRAIFIPCGDGGGGNGSQPTVEIIPFTIDLPDQPTKPLIPGVIVIEGRIKTLKEFFKVNLMLTNLSSFFTLTDLMATLEVPPGALTPIAPASGPVMLDNLGPGDEGTGHFIVRGDAIGTHTITVHFGGNLTGLGITQPIPISGSASTDLEVKGPPRMDVKVTHPDFVQKGVPYQLTVDIKNIDTELPALFASLELDVGGDAHLIDPLTGDPLTGPSVQAFGDILPGQSVTQTFTVLPLKTGPITSCTAGASQNLHLTVAFTGGGGPDCAIGTFPAERQDASGRPTVISIPTNNTTNVTIDPAVVAIFSAPMLTDTITAGFPGTSFRLSDPTGNVIPGTLEFSALGSGNTLAIFRPTDVLAFGTTYTITILPTIFDQNGLQLASGLTARFTTVGPPAQPDSDPPRPSIVIEPPVSPGSVPQGQLVPIRVDASDNIGVTRVDLLLDGGFVDTRMSPPPDHFMLDTSGLDPGTTHTLGAVAFDAQGNKGLASTTIVIATDSTPPSVQIVAASQVLRGRILPVTIVAGDNGHVAHVQVTVDDDTTPVFTGMMAPFQFGLQTNTIAAGPHLLHAKAQDGASNTNDASLPFEVIDDTQPPVIVFSSPASGAMVRLGSPLSVAATVTDDIGVDSVQFFLDGEVAPRATGFSGFTLDTHDLTLGSAQYPGHSQ